MRQPTKREFGYGRGGWPYQKAQDMYYEALKAWENRPRNTTAGRQRTRPIHPSWSEVLKHFDSNDLTRSQRAFCRWANLNPGTFSAMQCKAIPMHIAELIGVWNAQGKEVENG